MKTKTRGPGRTAAATTPFQRLANPREFLALAGLLLAAMIVVNVASANDAAASAAKAGAQKSVATPASTSGPASAASTVPLMSQEALLEHQAKHAAHLFVLDVRSPQEYAEGHVPGAVNVPYDQLGSRLAEVPKDKDVVVYCRSGRRSAIATDVLAANGYQRVSHLEGDMLAWLAKGRPVAKP